MGYIGRLGAVLALAGTALRADDDADIRALIDRIRANQPKLEARLEQFGYKETLDQTDGKDRKLETYEVTFYKGRKIRKLTSRDGKPLAGKELEKEDRRIEKEVTALSQGKIPPVTNRRVRLEDFRATEFSRKHEIVVEGRKLIECEFHPRPNFKPRNMNEKFIQNVDGKVWLDPEALQMAHVEFVLRGDFNVAGGLFFKMKAGTHYDEKQQWAFSEVWLPREQSFAMQGRAMLGIKLNVRNATLFSDYRRFDVNAVER
jgi:hypothetical protein